MCALLIPIHAQAGPLADQLGKCMVAHVSAKDQKTLNVWAFAAMSAHPDVKAYSKVTPSDVQDADKDMSALLTRLLTWDCKSDTKAAILGEGQGSLGPAFNAIGATAVGGLTQAPDVKAGLGQAMTHLDQTKMAQIFKQ